MSRTIRFYFGHSLPPPTPLSDNDEDPDPCTQDLGCICDMCLEAFYPGDPPEAHVCVQQPRCRECQAFWDHDEEQAKIQSIYDEWEQEQRLTSTLEASLPPPPSRSRFIRRTTELERLLDSQFGWRDWYPY